MKTLRILAVAVALLCATGTTYAQSLEDAAAKYTEAMEKVKSKSYKEAAVILKEAMNMGFDVGEEGLDLVKEIQTILPKVQIQAGITAVRANDFDGAIVELIQARDAADLYGNVQVVRQANRIISGVYQAKGATAFNEKDYKTALESFSKGYEQDPSNVKLANLTAKSHAELGDLALAITIYNSVIAMGEKNSRFEDDALEAKQDIATYLMFAATNAAAEKNLDKVLEYADMAPDSPEVQMLVMQTANNLKKFNVMIARGEAAATAQTDADLKSTVYYMLGVAYNNSDNNPKAVQILQKVTSGPNAAAAKTLAADLK